MAPGARIPLLSSPVVQTGKEGRGGISFLWIWNTCCENIRKDFDVPHEFDPIMVILHVVDNPRDDKEAT